jgi:hypothetical protein
MLRHRVAVDDHTRSIGSFIRVLGPQDIANDPYQSSMGAELGRICPSPTGISRGLSVRSVARSVSVTLEGKDGAAANREHEQLPVRWNDHLSSATVIDALNRSAALACGRSKCRASYWSLVPNLRCCCPRAFWQPDL